MEFHRLHNSLFFLLRSSCSAKDKEYWELYRNATIINLTPTYESTTNGLFVSRPLKAAGAVSTTVSLLLEAGHALT